MHFLTIIFQQVARGPGERIGHDSLAVAAVSPAPVCPGRQSLPVYV